MLIRRDQARRMLTLIHEAREIGAGEQQKLHLVAGIHRLLGAAMTSLVVLRNACDPRRRKIEQEMSTPPDRNVRTMIEALRTNSYVSRGLQEVRQILGGRAMVTFRRREILSDQEWYRSESFNALHRVCGFDDHLYSLRPLGSERCTGITIRRAVGERAFDEEDRNLLELFHEELVRLEGPQQGEGGPRLAPREREVLQRFLHGAREKEVASELNLSQHTVHSYAKAIYAAYGVSSRAELLAHCLAA